MAAKIISFVTMKGGSGKSTSAMCLGAYWHKAGKKVALIDADPAGTLVRWIEAGEDLAQLSAATAGPGTVEKQIDASRKTGADFIIIDTPGFQSDATDAAIRQADLLLIPMRPSPIDYQVAADTAEHVARLSDAPVRFVLNQTTRGSVIARHMRAQMEAAGLQPMAVEFPARVAYGEAALAGTTPSYYQPRGAAAAEIAEFAAETVKLLSRRRTKARKAGKAV
ncbi:ParA family protein [Nisaea acidiphila]|uniref:ParA family protein n=1 Tax=Nisaea acidiphila TaxID=1862145 RepID=A0A9J7ALX3_9PROT|nr:ParA family protein [Nisaea acidiphila]UUX48472.1 ParA family protein [Nisaea acidiphila]